MKGNVFLCTRISFSAFLESRIGNQVGRVKLPTVQLRSSNGHTIRTGEAPVFQDFGFNVLRPTEPSTFVDGQRYVEIGMIDF